MPRDSALDDEGLELQRHLIHVEPLGVQTEICDGSLWAGRIAVAHRVSWRLVAAARPPVLRAVSRLFQGSARPRPRVTSTCPSGPARLPTLRSPLRRS